MVRRPLRFQLTSSGSLAPRNARWWVQLKPRKSWARADVEEGWKGMTRINKHGGGVGQPVGKEVGDPGTSPVSCVGVAGDCNGVELEVVDKRQAAKALPLGGDY